ncbi:phosphoglycolate phosphatase [Halobiforma haloterrestris]|uniref:Phosphoglycolate phosphatase n=1 Tax=Natronobacterium haloterrestre TaxID=148448 RepID=A0A1I1JHP8_NATHA|nr:HAD hydrolase-like protein [Halobiforma haloterrestris]SFC48047.1 phosphoglycolate phosphatase [Halobiforma haloterrestris]
MTEYEAIVYDLDGTLVDLAVDWGRVTADVRAVYEDAGLERPGGDLWELLGAADDAGLRSAVESTIAAHEREGARSAPRLPRADELRNLEESVPVGVCSLNCERACRIALEEHGLLESVDAVVGRDSVATRKPHPEPLLETVRGIGASPDGTVFVGDSERDEVTARRAGTAFEYVDRQ